MNSQNNYNSINYLLYGIQIIEYYNMHHQSRYIRDSHGIPLLYFSINPYTKMSIIKLSSIKTRKRPYYSSREI